MAKRERTRLDDTAEGIGRTLGHLASRVDALNKQRRELANDVRRALVSGQAMLKSLYHDADEAPAEKPGGRRRKSGRPKGYTMSEETKAKLREAWAKRKAAAAEHASGAPEDARATIRAKTGRHWTNRQQGRG